MSTTAPPGLTRAEKCLVAVACLLATTVSVLGLLSSFQALATRAGLWGWDWPWMLPTGIDLSIPAFTITALLLIRIDMPLAWVAWVPKLLTGATVYLNWSAASTLPGQIGHAVLTLLWVVFSEIAGHVYASYIGARTGQRIEKIRRIRWALAPISTLIMWRYMRLWEAHGFAAVVDHRREATVFRARLRAEHGWFWWRNSRFATERLALRLSRVGVPIEETLDAPRRQAEEQRRAEQARQEEEQERLRVAEQEHAERIRQQREEQAELKRIAAAEQASDEEAARARRLAEAQVAAQLAEIERGQREADERAVEEARLREQAREREAVEIAERLAAAAKASADAEQKRREEVSRRREVEAQLRQMAPRPAPQPAAPGASQGAPAEPATAPRPTVPERHEPTPHATRQGATVPATGAPRPTRTRRRAPATRGDAVDAIKALYTELGRRPLESEMVDELKAIKSPFDSRQFAQKIRKEIEAQHPELAALGSDNVRAIS
ncbi:DUF2637 domain-containing protein [Streptomyces silaceus]|uniref:DUF2637 domain-containing protein n=1 Tax=Streptomyces silaceus TaxID=545123 RepID=UPI000AE1FB49|nr:DUF2637 domain-containing protein [Streptomyces silaceus]